MSWRRSLEEIRAGLADAERAAKAYPLSRYSEQVARARRWLELGGDRERFAELAVAWESRDGGIAHTAGLWFLAGDLERCHAWCQRMDTGDSAHRSAVASTLYLLGECEQALDWKSEDVTVAIELAQVKLSGDAHHLPEIRERMLLPYISGPGGGPHADYNGQPLTDWDWVEESFRLEAELGGTPVISHEGMLRELGVLNDEPLPGLPAPRSPVAGTRLQGEFGVWLDVVDEERVVLGRPRERQLWVTRLFGLWDASVMEPDGDRVETLCDAVFADWRHAASEGARIFARDWDKRAGEAMSRLVIEAGGNAGTPVMLPQPELPMPTQFTFPYLTSQDRHDVEFALASDLYVRMRDSGDGWWARISSKELGPEEEAFTGIRGTWRDAAERLSTWLGDHRAGYGINALRLLLDDPVARAQGTSPDWL